MTTIDTIRANEKASKINYLKNTILWHSEYIKELYAEKNSYFKNAENLDDKKPFDLYKIQLSITLKENSLQILEEEFKTILKTIK